MEDSSWSFSSKGWDNSRDINPLSAVYAVKKEVQAGTYTSNGFQFFKANELYLTTSYSYADK